MGAQAKFLFQSPIQLSSCSLNPNDDNKNPKFSVNIIRSCYTRSRSNGVSNTGPTAAGRYRFNPDDGFYTDGDDFSATQRSWWSGCDYDDDDDDDWEFDEDDESLISKIFSVFGWMLPAIGISFLLGTGPNTLLMALVPLGQSILTLAFDKVWGRTINRSKTRPRNKSKRKPFVTASSNTKTSQRKQKRETSEGRRSYQSWVVADGSSYENHDKSGPRFGGWDELDKKVGSCKAPKRSPSQMKNDLPKHQKKVTKLSRIGRIRETPLLLRLLIAVFPFLGSWTRLLF